MFPFSEWSLPQLQKATVAHAQGLHSGQCWMGARNKPSTRARSSAWSQDGHPNLSAMISCVGAPHASQGRPARVAVRPKPGQRQTGHCMARRCARRSANVTRLSIRVGLKCARIPIHSQELPAGFGLLQDRPRVPALTNRSIHVAPGCIGHQRGNHLIHHDRFMTDNHGGLHRTAGKREFSRGGHEAGSSVFAFCPNHPRFHTLSRQALRVRIPLPAV